MNTGMIWDIALTVSVWALPVLLAVTLHEAAHGWVAWRLGDDTAYRAGRVTFNPFKHIDPFGTILLPAILLFLSGGRMMFGFAKPVPVNFWRLHHFRRDTALVAIAGPGTNFLIAMACALALKLVNPEISTFQAWIYLNLQNCLWLNVLLGVFNLIPVPPLDGSRVLMVALPPRLGQRVANLERYGFAIIIGALFVLPWIGSMIGLDLNVFRWLVGIPSFIVANFIASVFGVELNL